MARGKRSNRATPLGSGYLLLRTIGLLLTVFAMGLISYPIATGMSDRLFTDRPCLLWLFIIFIIIIGLALYWLGERQGKRAM